MFLEQNLNKELLRFTTAGSVDDGKSTLIGRLLHDSKTVYEDQLASVKKSRINRSSGPIDFSLLTDGLRAEREQGITIDVGLPLFLDRAAKIHHRRHARARAVHAQHGHRSVDRGFGRDSDRREKRDCSRRRCGTPTSRRCWGFQACAAAINKMDLVEYREERFLRLEQDFLALAERLGIREVKCIPVSALAGDNVVERSDRMPWYAGPTLLEYLETVPIAGPALDASREISGAICAAA